MIDIRKGRSELKHVFMSSDSERNQLIDTEINESGQPQT